MDAKEMGNFIEIAKMGCATKDEIMEQLEVVGKELDELRLKVVDDDVSQNEMMELMDKDGQLQAFVNELETLLREYKNFNKLLCFANIRELIRQKTDVKIGQIEKEAGVRLGYMSRLEKEGNTSEPSMEFIFSAAKLLHVSIDTLVSVDITDLTPTEKYLVSFFDKLKEDTLADKLEWNVESAFYLNRLERDYNGFINHPLFDEETFDEENESDYPNEVTRIVFNSKSFGPGTTIADDCFNLRLKNGTTLYLMDIVKTVHRAGDSKAHAKEAWVFVPHKGCQLLVASQDKTPIAPLLEVLFDTVKNRMEHPRINKDVMYAIDSFMKDDLEDDKFDEEIPF